MNPLISLRKPAPLLLIVIALVSVAQAVSPPPDGEYPGANTAEGHNALFNLTTGGYNAAIGWESLSGVTSGSYNTGVGAGTLVLNNANNNTAVGTAALLLNIGGTENTANGAFALLSNDGSYNTAIGYEALFSNTDARNNTAIGAYALVNNTTGIENTANGGQALSGNTTGNGNTAVGYETFFNGTPGDFNTAVGTRALANCSGNNNIGLGYEAGYNSIGNDNIYIGNFGGSSESNTIRVGTPGTGQGTQSATYIAGILGANLAEGIPVYIDQAHRLGTNISSRRFKKEVKPMDKASEAILALKPVTFQYKSDKSNKPQFGLIAEDVAEISPDLVVRDKNGEIYTVRYDAVNAMLLNEFLKEHRKMQELEATIAQQQKSFQSRLAEEEKQIAALASGLQKVSAQLELDNPAPRMAVNKP
jgi:endosialidase-like protein